jgi:hypothetical protein
VGLIGLGIATLLYNGYNYLKNNEKWTTQSGRPLTEKSSCMSTEIHQGVLLRLHWQFRILLLNVWTSVFCLVQRLVPLRVIMRQMIRVFTEQNVLAQR